jgi:hypothetical protein
LSWKFALRLQSCKEETGMKLEPHPNIVITGDVNIIHASGCARVYHFECFDEPPIVYDVWSVNNSLQQNLSNSIRHAEHVIDDIEYRVEPINVGAMTAFVKAMKNLDR